MKAASKKPNRRNWIIRKDDYDDDVDVTKILLMITMQSTSKITLGIYKQMKRQNTLTNKN